MDAITIRFVSQRTSASFRLTDPAREALADMAERLGVSQAAVLELAIRAFAASHGIVVPPAPRRGVGRPRKTVRDEGGDDGDDTD